MHRSTLVALTALGLTLARTTAAAPSVWAIDDGEKIKEDATSLPFESGADNPVWSPGGPVRLFALRDETVAFQVVVEADDAGLSDVTVELATLIGPSGAKLENAAGARDPTRFVGRPIERFVEHYFDVARSSGGKDPLESLGWAPRSGPAPGAWVGRVPDALIPVEVAPSWDPYPLRIAPRRNGVVWIDLTLPREQRAGDYRGQVVVKASGNPLATLPVELTVGAATLPERPLKTMLDYDPWELERRIGPGDAAERHLWQLLRRHRLTPIHSAKTIAHVMHQLGALDGSIYTRAAGYEGPGIGVGDGLLSLGTYGSLGDPSEENASAVEQMASLLAAKGLLDRTEVFVYAVDEDCESPRGAAWKRLLAGRPAARGVRVAWTCSKPPAEQPVDIVMMLTGFDPKEAAAARAGGKEVWLYNGYQPHTGSFLTDAPAVSPRVNGWIQGMLGIERWFYWETTFWYDDNAGGKGRYDPFVTAETFHNQSRDHCDGDGVLLYPGKQLDYFGEHSLGMNGVLASIRLKNWRRGVEDAGYLELGRRANAARTDAIARQLLPRITSEAHDGVPPSWSERGAAFFNARRALFGLIESTPVPGDSSPIPSPSASPTPTPASAAPPPPSGGCGCRGGGGTASLWLGLSMPLAASLALRRRRRSKSRTRIGD